MKKRLTINDLAFGSLRTRRRQYASLTMGIALAIFFMAVMLVIGQSANHTMYLNYLRNNGSQDEIICDAEGIDPQALIDLGYAQRVGNMYVLGDAVAGNVPPSQMPLAIGYLDETAVQMEGRPLVSGRMPEAAGEIAIQGRILRWVAAGAKIGDEITLEVKLLKGEGEFLKETVERKYTLVGILVDSNGSGTRWSSVACLTIPSMYVMEESIEPGARPAIHRMVELQEEVSLDMLNTYVAAEMGRTEIKDIESRLYVFAYNSLYNMDSTMLVLIIFSLVLIMAACLGIVNSFSALLTERRNQIGLLRAVGATRRQIRLIFSREALIIALFATPFAVGFAVLFVWGVAHATELFSFYVTVPYLLLVVVISLASVMIAALIPLWNASGTSPMQAIRESSLQRAKKKIKVKRQKQFDPATLLARRHISLYRNKQAGISAIVAVSLVIVTLFFFLANSLQDFLPDAEAAGYKLITYNQSIDHIDSDVGGQLLSEADRAYIASLPSVKRVQGERRITMNLIVDQVTDYYFSPLPMVVSYYTYLLDSTDERFLPAYSFLRDRYLSLLEQQSIDGMLVTTNVHICDEDAVARMADDLIEGTIDMDVINRGESVIVCAPAKRGFRLSKEDDEQWVHPVTATSTEKRDAYAVNDMFFAGDTLKLNYLYSDQYKPVSEYYSDSQPLDYKNGVQRWDGTVQIGAVISKTDDESLFWPDAGDIITTYAGANALGIPVSGYDAMNVYLSGTPDAELGEYLSNEIEAISEFVPDMYFYDRIVSAQEDWEELFQLGICAVAVIVLFFAICLSMVNNALTNRMRSERRAIGTMRAVGASLGVIAQSYFKQLLIMLSSGFAVGVALSIIVIGLFIILGNVAIQLPLWILVCCELAFVALVLVASMLNLWSRLKGIMKSSIVENIREL